MVLKMGELIGMLDVATSLITSVHLSPSALTTYSEGSWTTTKQQSSGRASNRHHL